MAKEGKKKKTLHQGKDATRAEMENELFVWIMRRRARGLCVTKRMIITKAKELDEEIGHLIRIDGGSILGSTDCGVEKWWLRFAKRNNLSKRVTQ